MERLKIAERTTRGKLARVHSGKLIPGGKAPYGYQWRDETRSALAIDPFEGPIVCRMFEEFASGGTLYSLVTFLRSNDIPTPTGRGQWHAATIRDILLKHHYCGRAFAWGWRKRTAGHTQQFDPQKAIALPSGTVPPIVSEEVWEAVQTRMAQNRQRSTRNAKDPEAALLRGGFIRCGICGRTIQARPRSNGKTEYLRAKGRLANECPGCNIQAHTLDDAVWGRVSALLTDPCVIEAELDRLRGSDPTTHDLEAIDRSIAEIERQQGNLLQAIRLVSDPDSLALLTGQLTRIRNQRATLLLDRERLVERRETWNSSQASLVKLGGWCRTIASRIHSMSWADKRLALDTLGVQVKLYPHDQEPRFIVTLDAPVETELRTT